MRQSEIKFLSTNLKKNCLVLYATDFGAVSAYKYEQLPEADVMMR